MFGRIEHQMSDNPCCRNNSDRVNRVPLYIRGNVVLYMRCRSLKNGPETKSSMTEAKITNSLNSNNIDTVLMGFGFHKQNDLYQLK